MHDETVNRTTNGHGKVEDYTLMIKTVRWEVGLIKISKYARASYKMLVPTLDEI